MSASSRAGLSPCARLCGAVIAGVALAGPVHAQDASPNASPNAPQDAPQNAAKSDDGAATKVTITAKKKAMQRTADGVVYDESHNPKGQSGTAGDVLNTVPSVTVTPDGQVSLRGDSHVQVYVDGKPSAMMQGESRALTLEAMPGSAIASVEVITNPSAKYDANGGGIINIVLKKRKKPGAFGTLTLNYGNEGRKNAAFTADIAGRRLAFHTQLAVREDLRPKNETTNTDWLGMASGRSWQQSFVNARRHSVLALAGVDDALSDADQLSVTLTAKENHAINTLNEWHQDFDAAGDLADAYDRRSTGPRRHNDQALSGTFSHKAPDGGEFRLQAQFSQSWDSLDKSYINLFSDPVTPDTGVRVLTRSAQRLAELSGDGVVPAGADNQLSYGFDLQTARDAFANFNATLDPVTGQETVNPGLTNEFAVGQTVDAAYVTWQTTIRKLTVLAGLRAEVTRTGVDAGTATRQDFAGLIPTLHLTYALDDVRQLIASATDGFQRPDPRDLDPFTTYVDAQNETSGNPYLRPQRVASFEAGYVRSKGDETTTLTAYYKSSHDTVTDYSYFVTGNVLLTTKRNSGGGQSLGVEYVRAGKLGDKLSYNLSGNLFHTRLEADDLGGRLLRSGTSYTAKAELDYDLGGDSNLSLTGDAVGKAVTAQGWRSGTMTADLSWNRALTDRVRVFVSINDLADGAKVETVRRTSTVQQVDETFIGGRGAFVGLRYRFGGGRD